MRTTIQVKPEAYAIAKAYAHQHRVSLGDAVSELILAKNRKESGLTMSEAGFLQFHPGRTLTEGEIRAIIDDE